MEGRTEIICNGPSMKPTLLPGDRLETEEISFDQFQPGDIIIYNSPENFRLSIVHRIIKRNANSLITRGDNNSQVDPCPVQPEHCPLKVIAVIRGSERLPVGRHGMILHRLMILQMKLRSFKNKRLYPVYALIADLGIFHPAGTLFKTNIHKFYCQNGVETHLFVGKHRIGILYPKTERWQIYFPWKLFIKPPDMNGTMLGTDD